MRGICSRALAEICVQRDDRTTRVLNVIWGDADVVVGYKGARLQRTKDSRQGRRSLAAEFAAAAGRLPHLQPVTSIRSEPDGSGTGNCGFAPEEISFSGKPLIKPQVSRQGCP